MIQGVQATQQLHTERFDEITKAITTFVAGQVPAAINRLERHADLDETDWNV